jgi:hypothetical protein
VDVRLRAEDVPVTSRRDYWQHGARIGSAVLDLLAAALATRLDRASSLPADAVHFSRLFRARMGASALEFRLMHEDPNRRTVG